MFASAPRAATSCTAAPPVLCALVHFGAPLRACFRSSARAYLLCSAGSLLAHLPPFRACFRSSACAYLRYSTSNLLAHLPARLPTRLCFGADFISFGAASVFFGVIFVFFLFLNSVFFGVVFMCLGACFGAPLHTCFGVAICSVVCWGAATVVERYLGACALSNSLISFRLLKLVQVPFFSNASFTGSGWQIAISM